MADKSIFELNLQTTFAPNDRLVVGNYANSDAEAITGQQLIALLATALDGHGGIASIAKTSSSGTNPVVDTYTVTYADATTTTFTVTNGLKGDTGAQTYVWLRWAHTQPTQWSDTSSNPDDWMGIYTGLASTQPTTVSSYAWYEIKGDKGDTGDAASLVSTSVDYQTSSSGTVVPSGTWTSTVPTVAQGDFLWTRTMLTFNSGSPITSYAVSYAGIDGQGSPSSATPQMDNGNGSAGVGTAFSRDDHVHPSDTSKQDLIAASGMLKGAGNGSVSAATKGTDYGALSFTVTLASASWSSLAQTVSNANFITSGYAYIVSPASASFTAYGEAGIYADDVTTTGQMTFHCSEAPSSNLTVNIVRVVAT